MASKRPTTIAEYIRAAPREGQPHLRRLCAILKTMLFGSSFAAGMSFGRLKIRRTR